MFRGKANCGLLACRSRDIYRVWHLMERNGTGFTTWSAFEYCLHLGIDPAVEADAYYAIAQALTAPIPAGWGCLYSSSGNVDCAPGLPYFVNHHTGESQWEHPCEAGHISSACTLLLGEPRQGSKLWREWRKQNLLRLALKSAESPHPGLFVHTHGKGDQPARLVWDESASIHRIRTFADYFSVKPSAEYDRLWVVSIATICDVPNTWEVYYEDHPPRVFVSKDLSTSSLRHPCDTFFETLLGVYDNLFPSPTGAGRSILRLPVIGRQRPPLYYDWASGLFQSPEVILQDARRRVESLVNDNMGNSGEWLWALARALESAIRFATREGVHSVVVAQFNNIKQYCGNSVYMATIPQILNHLEDILLWKGTDAGTRGSLHALVLASRALLLKFVIEVGDLVRGILDICTVDNSGLVGGLCQVLIRCSVCLNSCMGMTRQLVLKFFRLLVKVMVVNVGEAGAVAVNPLTLSLKETLYHLESVCSCEDHILELSCRPLIGRLGNVLRNLEFDGRLKDPAVGGLFFNEILDDLECTEEDTFRLDINSLTQLLDAYPPGAYIVSDSILTSLDSIDLLKVGHLVRNMANSVNDTYANPIHRTFMLLDFCGIWRREMPCREKLPQSRHPLT